MTAFTPYPSLPYPEDTDPVEGGAAAIQALAEQVSTLLRDESRGVVNVPVTASTSGTAAIVFDAGVHTDPIIQLTVVGTSTYFAYATGSPSASGVTIGVRHYEAVSNTTTVPVHWTVKG